MYLDGVRMYKDGAEARMTPYEVGVLNTDTISNILILGQ